MAVGSLESVAALYRAEALTHLNEIEVGKPGGYILFGRDFDNKTKSKIISELENNQKTSKIKMILGVDEEGGTVVRVSSHKAFRSSKFLSPQEIYNNRCSIARLRRKIRIAKKSWN